MAKKLIYTVGILLLVIIMIMATVFGLSAAGVINIVGLKEKLIFASAGVNDVYDGTEKTNSNCQLISGELNSGHSAVFAVTGTRTEAGVSYNFFSATIVNGSGEDVSDLYSIEYQPGAINIGKRPVEISITNIEKIFSKVPIIAGDYSIISGSLAEGHELSVTYDEAQTEITESSVILKVFDADGNDVSANYDLKKKFGSSGGLKVPVIFESESSEWTYDAETHKLSEFSVKSGIILAGHTVEASFTGAIKNAGTADNKFTVIIRDADGNDVSSLYSIDYVYGTLTVNKRKIVIQTSSANKVYDGAALSSPDWEIVSITKPIEGQSVEVAVIGSQTEVGESENDVAETVIKSGEETVTANYEIEYKLGILTVTEAPSNGEGEGEGSGEGEGGGSGEGEGGGSGEGEGEGSGEGEGGGSGEGEGEGTGSGAGGGSLDTSGGLGGGAGENNSGSNGENSIVLKMKSNISGQIYLRLMSFGDYTGKGFETAPEYTVLLDGKYSANYLPSLAMLHLGRLPASLEVQSFTTDYLLPTYLVPGEGYKIQASDVTNTGPELSEYTVGYFSIKNSDAAALAASLTGYVYGDAELLYRDFVYDTYLSIDEVTLSFMNSLISEQGFSADDADIISKVAQYISGAAEYNLEYDTALDEEENCVTAFLETYKEGVCRHYAASATMLFRALGIPARYTVGYSAVSTKDNWTNVTADRAHAWVEVYVNGLGWVCVEVTGSSSAGGNGGEGGAGGGSGEGGAGGTGGGSIDDGTTIMVTPIFTDMRYDGISICKPIQEVSGNDLFRRLTAAGYTYTAVITGERQEPGFCETVIESFTLFDPEGNDVTENFEINKKDGRLQVYVEELTITSNGATKVYDGLALTNESFVISGTILEGHRYDRREATGTQINVGKSRNTVSVKIVNELGEDVTSWYKLTRELGVLEVTVRNIHIVAESATKAYDGEALTASGYMLEGTLAEGETIEVTVTGSQTNIGRCDNVVTSIIIRNADGEDVSLNYSITHEKGLLKVTP